MRILITDGLHERGRELLIAAAQVDDRTGISAVDLLDAVPNYDAMIVRGRTQVTAQVFEYGTRLKVVGRAGVGVDNIDLAAAEAHGVIVVNAPKATTLAVAEHTLGLMLALARMIPRADSSMKAAEVAQKGSGGRGTQRQGIGCNRGGQHRQRSSPSCRFPGYEGIGVRSASHQGRDVPLGSATSRTG